MKQIIGRIWLGRAKVTFTRIGAYFSYINFLLLIATFYSITGYQYAPLWLFVSVSVIGIIFMGVIDYFVMLPSEQAFLNQQFVRHQNPIYDEVQQLRKDLEKDEENV
jgi:hypothetical protein